MSERLTDEELLAKMKTHFQERKALYDALVDNPNRVIANSGTESLQTSGSVDKATRYPQLGADHE